MPKLTHVGDDGRLAMVDVSAKDSTVRCARAQARVRMLPETEDALRAGALPKGDALTAAQLAGILAAKDTPRLIPLAHSLPLASVDVAFAWVEPGVLQIETTAKTTAQTGVEMEAMVAASVAALTIYDMAKGVERGIVVESVRLLEKSGGKSGSWRAPK